MKTGVLVASVAAPSKTATETEPQQGDGRTPTTRGEVEAPKVKKGRRRKKNKKQRPRMPPRVTASSTCVRVTIVAADTPTHTDTHTCTQRHVEDDVGRITYSHAGGFRRVVPYNYVYVVRSWWHPPPSRSSGPATSRQPVDHSQATLVWQDSDWPHDIRVQA